MLTAVCDRPVATTANAAGSYRQAATVHGQWHGAAGVAVQVDTQAPASSTANCSTMPTRHWRRARAGPDGDGLVGVREQGKLGLGEIFGTHGGGVQDRSSNG